MDSDVTRTHKNTQREVNERRRVRNILASRNQREQAREARMDDSHIIEGIKIRTLKQ